MISNRLFYDLRMLAHPLNVHTIQKGINQKRHQEAVSQAWGDDFRSSAWFIRSLEFQRDSDGAVTGFLVNGGERVRNLRFVKR